MLSCRFPCAHFRYFYRLITMLSVSSPHNFLSPRLALLALRAVCVAAAAIVSARRGRVIAFDVRRQTRIYFDSGMSSLRAPFINVSAISAGKSIASE